MWKLLALILLTTAIIAGIAFSSQKSPGVTVETTTVDFNDVTTTIDLTGHVINDHTVTLTALLDGEIEAIHAREGARVNSEDILAELDNRQAIAMRNKASAELSYQDEARKSASRNYERLKNVSNNGNTSRQVLEDSLIKLRSIEAQLKKARAELLISELRLENAKIKAPFDGVVIEQTAEKGQWLEAGTQLFTLVALDGNIIEVKVDAADSGRVAMNQPVLLSSEAAPTKSWTSSVSWIAPSVSKDGNNGSLTLSVRIAINENAPELLIGEQLEVALETDRRENVISVPTQAVFELSPGNHQVYILADGNARAVNVELGLQSINSVQIVDGLTEGDEVIITSNVELADGVPVSARSFE